MNGFKTVLRGYDKDEVKSYLDKVIKEYERLLSEVKLKDDELYVLGDNRIVSLDSRAFGPIQYKDIKAKNGLVIFPFNEIRCELRHLYNFCRCLIVFSWL